MMLVVVIPAYNEEKTIGNVIKDIPRKLFDNIKILVIDDGSTDNTVKEAKKSGADKIVSFDDNKGLANAFRVGLDTALDMGADIIVNIDADHQYYSEEIPDLIQPIIDGKADIVLGSRFKGQIEYMPKRKRLGNILATRITGFLIGSSISDAQTGFRALSREAALRQNILSDYTYTQEMIIQSVHKGLRLIEVPCKFRARRAGESRLITGIFEYARRGGLTILRTYRDYSPLRTFLLIGGILSLIGLVVGLRVLVHFFLTGAVSPYIPSAILTVVLLIVGFQIMILGLIGDMVTSNRRLLEEIIYRLKSEKRARA